MPRLPAALFRASWVRLHACRLPSARDLDAANVPEHCLRLTAVREVNGLADSGAAKCRRDLRTFVLPLTLVFLRGPKLSIVWVQGRNKGSREAAVAGTGPVVQARCRGTSWLDAAFPTAFCLRGVCVCVCGWERVVCVSLGWQWPCQILSDGSWPWRRTAGRRAAKAEQGHPPPPRQGSRVPRSAVRLALDDHFLSPIRAGKRRASCQAPPLLLLSS